MQPHEKKPQLQLITPVTWRNHLAVVPGRLVAQQDGVGDGGGVVLQDEVHVGAVVHPIGCVEAQVAHRALPRAPPIRQAVLDVQVQLLRGVHTCTTGFESQVNA